MGDFLNFKDGDFKRLGFNKEQRQLMLTLLKDCAKVASELEEASPHNEFPAKKIIKGVEAAEIVAHGVIKAVKDVNFLRRVGI